LHVPQSYTGKKPVPLVLDFHGLTSSASQQKSMSGYLQLSNKEGFIVAWPTGKDRAWNFGPCCTRSRQVDDVGFARAIVDQLKEKGCIDSKRVYAVGLSNGGGLAHVIACEAADVFAAVAPSSFDLVQEVECKPSRPISVIAYRSTNDPIVPYAGGRSTPPTLYPLDPIHFLGAEGTFKKWAEIDGCTGSPENSYSGGGWKCRTYSECKEGVEVTLCNGANSHVNGNENIAWQVLTAHPMP
jgi:polyhydroxybutyrate depolymerase